MNALVVVPTYNERDNLPVLARGVLAHPGFRMLVVDDGSPDGTGEVADALVPSTRAASRSCTGPASAASGGRTSTAFVTRSRRPTPN